MTSSQGTNPQTAQATLVVSAPANITGSKAFVPANVHGNGATQTSFSTLTITLTNPNAVRADQCGDHRYAARRRSRSPRRRTRRPPAAQASATASAPATNPATIALTGGTIPANGSCTITVQVIARNPNAVANGNFDQHDPRRRADHDARARPARRSPRNINVQTGARSPSRSRRTTVPAGGAASTMTHHVSNFNQTTLTPITFTDTWAAAGMSVSGVPTTTCGGTLTNTANSVTLTGGSLGPAPAGAGATTCTITVPGHRQPRRPSTTSPPATSGGVAYTGTGSGTLTVSTITGSKTFSAPARADRRRRR